MALILECCAVKTMSAIKNTGNLANIGTPGNATFTVYCSTNSSGCINSLSVLHMTVV